jgi:hypothetical protein
VLITYWRRNPEPNLTGRRGGRAQISRCITALRLFRRSSFSLIFHTNDLGDKSRIYRAFPVFQVWIYSFLLEADPDRIYIDFLSLNKSHIFPL